MDKEQAEAVADSLLASAVQRQQRRRRDLAPFVSRQRIGASCMVCGAMLGALASVAGHMHLAAAASCGGLVGYVATWFVAWWHQKHPST